MEGMHNLNAEQLICLKYFIGEMTAEQAEKALWDLQKPIETTGTDRS